MTKTRLPAYPLSCLCIVLIWYLSLFFIPPETSLGQVRFIDKWTHLVMYGGTCSVIWWEYLRHHHSLCPRRLLWWAWLAPIAMSGLLELLQEYCTVNRSGEWLDLAANATGATLGQAAGLLMHRLRRGRAKHGAQDECGSQEERADQGGKAGAGPTRRT